VASRDRMAVAESRKRSARNQAGYPGCVMSINRRALNFSILLFYSRKQEKSASSESVQQGQKAVFNADIFPLRKRPFWILPVPVPVPAPAITMGLQLIFTN
jgi:hypothetical protein